MKEEIILGVDPGTNQTGYGLIHVQGNRTSIIDYGVITLRSAELLSLRYRKIHEGIVTLVKKYRPTALVTETQYVSKNVQSAIKLGMARGVVILAASLENIPVFEYAPTRAKRSVVGNGGASKQQVQKMMQVLLGLAEPPEPEDAADALALAICHAHLTTTQSHLPYQT